MLAKPRMPKKGALQQCIKVAKKAAREFLLSAPEEPAGEGHD